jgi:hypothetical protein
MTGRIGLNGFTCGLDPSQLPRTAQFPIASLCAAAIVPVNRIVERLLSESLTIAMGIKQFSAKIVLQSSSERAVVALHYG